MKQKKAFIIILGVSLLANVALLLHISILKSEYSWLRDTYEADIVGMYQSNGLWLAYKERLEGNPKEYILDSASPSMGIAVENFYSHKPEKARNIDMFDLMYRLFNKTKEPQRPWHMALQNRWLEAFVKEHNATISRLLTETPNQPLQ